MFERLGRSRNPIPLIPLSVLQGSSPRANPKRIRFAGRGKEMQEYSPEEFERVTGVGYTGELVFAGERTYQDVSKDCAAAMRIGRITPEMKWLGAYHAVKLRNQWVANVSIRWIDEAIGHGLFAEQEIEEGELIGEYTGIVRRRNVLIGRNRNEYCFSYPTSDFSFKKHMIDAKPNSNELRYINDSDDPNCEGLCVWLDDLLRVIIRSIQRIPKGDQITYNYSLNFWKSRPLEPKRKD